MSFCARAQVWTVAAVCWAAVSAHAETTVPLEVNAFNWSIKEPRIVLGETASVEVTLTAKAADGAPLDVAPPRLTTSTGAVTPPERTAPGTWTMVFTPPKESFPHVAILFATVETSTTTAVGFTSLHLWGKGQTAVRTKPKSKVTVFIGNESFGPVDADEDGAALVPIVVPPGPERAVARSVDDVGNETQKTIDLGVPTFNRLAMVALDDVAAADGAGAARLLVFAVDKKGEPLYEAELKAHASAGEVAAPVPLSPGMFELVYRPGKAPRGKATVDVELADAPGSVAQASVQLLSGPPAKAQLDSSTTTLSADDPREVQMVMHVLDGAGNAVPAQATRVDVDFGRIDAVADNKDGGRVITWIVPPTLRDRTKATLTVKSKSGDVLGAREVALIAGKPARLSFDPVDAVIADGQSSVEVHLRVVDKVGNPLVPTGAKLASAQGQLVGATVDGKLYRARFIPPATDRADFARIDGSLGALRATAEVKLVPRPRARLLVGPAVVVESNYGPLVQAGPDISLLVRLPGFDGSAHAGLSVSLLQSVRAPPDVDHRAFPVFLEGAWRPLLTPDFAVHLGAGAGFVITDEIDAPNTRREKRVVTPGAVAQAVAGVAYRVGPGFFELDARAGYGQTFPAQSVGAPLGAGLVLGYRFGI